MQTHRVLLTLIFVCSLAVGEESTHINAPIIMRKDVLTATIDPEKSVATVEIKQITLGPKQNAPLHLHPCPVVGVIVEGAIKFQIEGQAVQHLKAGDAFYEPANVHITHFDNEGDTPVIFSAFYFLGKNEHELIRILPN